ncbi:carbamate kinase [Candidatus Fermentibacteria bacterium]|nr:MAG: carbamate kinase [Candidatus Fermentibacteria bacterium]
MRNKGRIVVAIGGNSLITPGSVRGNKDTHEVAREVCEELAEIAGMFGSLVVTHGNGPQVGYELIRNAQARDIIPPDGMDVNVAATQGIIGYFLQQVLGDVLEEQGVDIPVSSVITQVQVKPDDSGFQNPTKPVGPFYTEEEARRLKESRNWIMREDAGRGWRRVVPSPIPKKIVELDCINALVEAGQIVIACGGGGVPVVREGEKIRGVAAVIDKDHATALLATRLNAPTFVISTGVPEVYINFGTPEQKALRSITAAEARQYMDQGHFASGSMKPKIRAALGFLEHGGSRVVISSPGNLVSALKRETGTTITA